ncbi:predicted protein [Plenodomus lingam JN3]|uniref:Predicted protein n=1 Tax=Leptosphaeria maculans (strain JN3 / isolate v23.1.3 / race Av1-4-5-6-7-8) TaxID=985895 RepID=E4ZLU8_LEPMJ|nr:predicted protein [Plenodomus lingam JN3]CBX92778.1 predicted protein [Plenodomus lingam JN3]
MCSSSFFFLFFLLFFFSLSLSLSLSPPPPGAVLEPFSFFFFFFFFSFSFALRSWVAHFPNSLADWQGESAAQSKAVASSRQPNPVAIGHPFPSLLLASLCHPLHPPHPTHLNSTKPNRNLSSASPKPNPSVGLPWQRDRGLHSALPPPHQLPTDGNFIFRCGPDGLWPAAMGRKGPVTMTKTTKDDKDDDRCEWVNAFPAGSLCQPARQPARGRLLRCCRQPDGPVSRMSVV